MLLAIDATADATTNAAAARFQEINEIKNNESI